MDKRSVLLQGSFTSLVYNNTGSPGGLKDCSSGVTGPHFIVVCARCYVQPMRTCRHWHVVSDIWLQSCLFVSKCMVCDMDLAHNGLQGLCAHLCVPACLIELQFDAVWGVFCCPACRLPQDFQTLFSLQCSARRAPLSNECALLRNC
jgi:hypothetical protein